jgi:hypothetical protein
VSDNESGVPADVDIEKREISLAEFDRAFELHNSMLGDDRSASDWLWEYKGVYPQSSVFVIGRLGSKILGTQGMIPIYLNIEGERFLTGKSENSLVDPTLRGSGFFRSIYDVAMELCRKRGMRCIWGFTPATKVWRKTLGFDVYENVMLNATRVIKLRTALNQIAKSETSYGKKIRLYLGALALLLYSRGTVFLFSLRISKTHGGYTIETEPRTMDDVSHLYSRLRLSDPRLIHIEQDREYYNWRILKNPNVKYETLFVYAADGLKAYCYFTVGSSKVAYITDLASEEDAALGLLMGRVMSRLSSLKAGRVLFTGNAKNASISHIFEELRKMGFVNLRGLRASFVLKNVSCDESIRDLSRWYLVGLWAEGYEW